MLKKPILIHNPRCSKSREAHQLLKEAGIDFLVIDYLKDGLKEKLLVHLPKLLGLKYGEMVRKNETLFQELNLKDKDLTDGEWLEILMKHPVLLERPVFIKGEKAVIGRPPEKVLSL